MKKLCLITIVLLILANNTNINQLYILKSFSSQNDVAYYDNNKKSYSISNISRSSYNFSEKKLDKIDYSQFINKIWVEKEWNYDKAYSYPCSFFITNITNDKISGKLATNKVAYPESFTALDGITDPDLQSHLAYFTGVIEENIAVCQFISKDGKTGTIKLQFKENNEIEAKINCDTIDFMDKRQNGDKLIFKPHNISDLKGIYNKKTKVYKTELNTWGSVNIVTVWFDGMKPFPDVFLTNEHNDIFYNFGAFPTGSEIIDVSIDDINGGYLKKIKFTLGFVNYKTGITDKSDPTYCIAYQLNNGLFYSEFIEPN